MELRPFRLIGRIFALLGGVFLAVALVFLALCLRNGFSGGLWIPLLPFGAVGAVFFGIGTGFLALVRRKVRRRDALLAGGRCVRAAITGVERNRSVQINGRHPYRVLCRYTDETGTVHEFRSWDLDYDPTGLFLADEVDVYFDPYDMGRYYVDLSRVLRKIVIHGA